ncbi:MAG: hypothetical protein JW996_02155 [Candidatus Cloacimonetes bacterium]|nr:hypothetical protein [Candidatus Cloacimonadota bacterium]
MKKILFLVISLCIFLPLFSETEQLTDFSELITALKQGEIVRVVVDYGQCQLISGNEEKDAPQATGGMTIDVFEYFAPHTLGNQRAFLVFSHSSLINYGGFIYNYVKFKIYDDDSVKITAQYVSTTDFEIEMDENFFSKINNGKDQGAVYFYRIK